MNKLLKFGVSVPLLAASIFAIGTNAHAADYYDSITNTTSGATLASDLHTLLANTHTNKLSYDDLWNAYYTSDVMPGTKIIWDTYSECIYTVGDDQDHGDHKVEGDSYNREHIVPQSWFDKELPMVADAFHIFATDAAVNGKRSNFLHGEVGNATYTSNNGGKLGSSNFSGYSGTVFEPIDEYKGDIARAYLYMAIRYSDKCGSWGSDANKIFTSSYPYLTNYAKNIFMKWAHEDPVSDKEYIRNEALYDIQHDRNPFIDHPEWTDVIWENDYEYTETKTRYSVSDVESAISSLSNSSSKDTVYLTYQKYCRLNTGDKKSVSNADALFSIVESKANTGVDLASYWDNILSNRGVELTIDETKVANVIALIDTLPDTITLDNQEEVALVKAEYNKLNSLEKSLVTNHAKLSSAIATIEILNAEVESKNVIALIDALPDTITLSDKEKIDEAEKAYNSLSASAKEKVTNYSKLQNAISQVDELMITTYELVTDASELKVNDEVIIVASSYDIAVGDLYKNYYRSGADIQKNSGSIKIGKDDKAVNVFVLTEGTSDGTFGFYNGSEYLAAEATHTNLFGVTTLDGYASWKVSIESNGNATITASSTTTTTKEGTFNASMFWDSKYNDFNSTKTIPSDGYVSIYKNPLVNVGGDEKPLYTKFEKLDTKSSMMFNYSKTVVEAEGDGSYSLVTDASKLAVGDQILIVGVNNSTYCALSTNQKSNNRGTTKVSVSDNKIASAPSDAQVLTLVEGKKANSFGLYTGSGYLYAASSSSNYLRTQNEMDDNSSFIFEASNGTFTVTAQGGNSKKILRYNSSNDLFSCYASGQNPVYIYKLSGSSEKTVYTYSNVKLRYGVGMTKELYDSLVDTYDNVSFGVAISLDGTNYKNNECSVAQVESLGAKEESNTGKFIQYSVVFNVPEKNFESLVYAKAYVMIDGEVYYANEASYSVKTLAAYYISNAKSLSLSDETLSVLGGLK